MLNETLCFDGAELMWMFSNQKSNFIRLKSPFRTLITWIMENEFYLVMFMIDIFQYILFFILTCHIGIWMCFFLLIFRFRFVAVRLQMNLILMMTAANKKRPWKFVFRVRKSASAFLEYIFNSFFFFYFLFVPFMPWTSTSDFCQCHSMSFVDWLIKWIFWLNFIVWLLTNDNTTLHRPTKNNVEMAEMTKKKFYKQKHSTTSAIFSFLLFFFLVFYYVLFSLMKIFCGDICVPFSCKCDFCFYHSMKAELSHEKKNKMRE